MDARREPKYDKIPIFNNGLSPQNLFKFIILAPKILQNRYLSHFRFVHFKRLKHLMRRIFYLTLYYERRLSIVLV